MPIIYKIIIYSPVVICAGMGSREISSNIGIDFFLFLIEPLDQFSRGWVGILYDELKGI